MSGKDGSTTSTEDIVQMTPDPVTGSHRPGGFGLLTAMSWAPIGRQVVHEAAADTHLKNRLMDRACFGANRRTMHQSCA